jgi:hypothetical protein
LPLKRSVLVKKRLNRERRTKKKMGKVRRLVLDVLKPLDPTIIQLAQLLSGLSGVEAVNISIYEIDRRVENAKITIEGSDILYESVVETIQENGGTVHSIDEVVAGKMIIEDAATPQD